MGNRVLRPDLKKIEKSYDRVLSEWAGIDDALDKYKIGRKDTPFDRTLMDNMLLAWDFLDYLIKKNDYSLLSQRGGPDMLEINNLVHYGLDENLRTEYRKAIEATIEKFSLQITPIRKYYATKRKQNASTYRIAAEIYISILGMPQLYIEGNHRSGSLIASWINLTNGKPPFVLTVENALSFFAPAQEIKKFNKRSMWRSMTQLPKYKKDFKVFWKTNCDWQFARTP